MKSDYGRFTAKIAKLIGIKVGQFTIMDVKLLDANTTLICCSEIKNEYGSEHMEAEHWLDENTFHFNNLCFDKQGNFIDSEPASLKLQLRRSFENIFMSIAY